MNKHLFYLSLTVILFWNCKEPTLTSFDRSNQIDPIHPDFSISAPYSFEITPVNQDDIHLSWNDTVSYTSGYILERLQDDLNESSRWELPKETTSFTDTSVNASSITRYRLNSFYKSEEVTKHSDSLVNSIDFGSYRYGQETEVDYEGLTLTLNWSYEYDWNYIVLIQTENQNLDSLESNLYVNLDTLINGETIFNTDLQENFNEYLVYARFYPSFYDLENDIRIGNMETGYFPDMEFLPEIVNIEVINENRVVIEWEDNSPFEDGFQILRGSSETKSDEKVIATLPPNTTSFVDTLNPFQNFYLNSSGQKTIKYGILVFAGDTQTGMYGTQASLE